MFFATPHYGTGDSDWEKLMSHIVTLCNSKRAYFPTLRGSKRAQAPTNAMLMEIRQNCQVLTNISEDFRHLSKEFRIVSFLEENKTELLGDVVSYLPLCFELYHPRFRRICDRFVNAGYTT